MNRVDARGAALLLVLWLLALLTALLSVFALSARTEPSEGGGNGLGPRCRRPPREPFLEPDVFRVAEPAIGVQRRRIVGPDVEHHRVADLQQRSGDGAGDRSRVTPAAEVDVGQDVADDGEP